MILLNNAKPPPDWIRDHSIPATPISSRRISQLGTKSSSKPTETPQMVRSCIPEIDITANLFADQLFPTWEKYRDVGAGAVIGTFRYIFNKFKKGIFVKIQGNKVVVFSSLLEG